MLLPFNRNIHEFKEIFCSTFLLQISQFFMKDENTTKQPQSMHSSKVMRSRTQSHSLICTSPVLQERHNSLMANKATQTELDVPGSAGTSGENSIKKIKIAAENKLSQS